MSQLPEHVRRSLTDERFDWRTAEGVASDAGADLETVARLLELSPEVRRASRPNRIGRALYQLKRKETLAERLLRAFANAPA